MSQFAGGLSVAAVFSICLAAYVFAVILFCLVRQYLISSGRWSRDCGKTVCGSEGQMGCGGDWCEPYANACDSCPRVQNCYHRLCPERHLINWGSCLVCACCWEPVLRGKQTFCQCISSYCPCFDDEGNFVYGVTCPCFVEKQLPSPLQSEMSLIAGGTLTSVSVHNTSINALPV